MPDNQINCQAFFDYINRYFMCETTFMVVRLCHYATLSLDTVGKELFATDNWEQQLISK
jgi:hypothetical protein